MPEETTQLARTCAEARDWMRSARNDATAIGLVPTMGALHEGHLSLIRAAQARCDRVAVTIFVNPTQFGPAEDFSKYPRTIDADLKALRELRVDMVFLPDREELYPAGFSTYVLPPAVAAPFEGAFRPEHFQGVTTIVLKLFHLLTADIAFFGQKDYQQCQVLRHMIADLNVPIEMQICPTVRESDGLAMSSRNRYLGPGERAQATALCRALRDAVQRVQQGTTDASVIAQSMHAILTQAGVTEIDYAAVADAGTLAAIERIEGPAVALIAARIGATRLIDNALLPGD